MANPMFVLKRSADAEFFFNLQAANGEIILTSETYTTKASATQGTAAVQVNAPLDERYVKYVSGKGEPYFVLRAANHEVIGKSEMYSSNAARDNGIEAVKRAAPMAEALDRTLL
jgi:uncharacterized protein